MSGTHGLDGPGESGSADDRTASQSDAAVLERVAEALASQPAGVVLIEFVIEHDGESAIEGRTVDDLINARLEVVVEPSAIVAGPAVDQVAIIRRAMSAPAEAESVAFRLHELLSGPVTIGPDGEVAFCRAAIGVAVSRAGDTAPALLGYAQHALADARMLGGDTVVVFDDIDRDLLLP